MGWSSTPQLQVEGWCVGRPMGVLGGYSATCEVSALASTGDGMMESEGRGTLGRISQ